MSKRNFNFSSYKQRHIALKIAYFGWNYAGLAYQPSTENTVEGRLIDALLKTHLIQSLETCCLVRSGRTDKGVSSYGQVINLNVRSQLTDVTNPVNIGLFTPNDYSTRPPEQKIAPESANKSNETEFDYVNALNRVLPGDIRILAWSPVARSFSARFNCKQRSYSYIFPIGNLCVQSMAEGLENLVGEHDFRNFCTFDLDNNVVEHRRSISSATIELIENPSHQAVLVGLKDYCYYRVRIIGKAFLYHQIRCIMTIIFLIGAKREHPSLVKHLLDIENCQSKPMYNYASALPLSLVSCDFDVDDLPQGWICNAQALQALRKHLKHMWFEQKTKVLMIEDVLADVESRMSAKLKITTGDDDDIMQPDWKDFDLSCDNRNVKSYVPILSRKRHDSLEKRLKTLSEKKSIKKSNNVNTDQTRPPDKK